MLAAIATLLLSGNLLSSMMAQTAQAPGNTSVQKELIGFRTKGNEAGWHVEIGDRLCLQTVVVLLDGRELHGCGDQSLALLQGAEWVVEDINGKGIIDRSRVTLNFLEENRLVGMASCNNYITTYSLTGEGLTISQAAATLKACTPALMNQEQLFLEVLKNIQQFEISADGTLILQTNDQRTITARGLTQ
ncbi:MAG: META domain-containing protein [Chloroflexaceae bacterium]|nr:META domain-containing protein [Chloroflexaceae bacterium]